MLARQHVSVLVGPAGTGKTTLLATLCAHPDIERNGVLLLAPTGKARVRLQDRIGRKARTIAQFLLPLDRFVPETGVYRKSKHAKHQGERTLIIDEASMLTEEQLAATLDGLSGIDRLILVGDPRQLPPIGAGRPFVDIVEFLAPEDAESRWPRVAPGYAELTVVRRGGGTHTDDLRLADWFGGARLEPAADAIWSEDFGPGQNPSLALHRWEDVSELPDLVASVVARELRLASETDEFAFELRIGGDEFQGAAYFHAEGPGKPSSGARVEEWQLLSPLRGQGTGASRSQSPDPAPLPRGRAAAGPVATG